MSITKCLWLTIAITLGLTPGLWAQVPAEVRTLLVSLPNSTDQTHQYGLSKLHDAWVCPVCGYSSPVGGQCPDPFRVPGHGAGVNLIWMGPLERVLSIVTPQASGGATPPWDIRYADTSGTLQYRAVVGRPFHPQQVLATDVPGDKVYAECGFRFPTLPTRAHLVTLAPGVKEPYCTIKGFPVPVGGVGGTTDFKSWHNGAVDTGATGIQASEVAIALNPLRAANHDVYYVRWISRSVDITLADPTNKTCRLLVYSQLYGLEFDSNQTNGTNPQTGLTMPGLTTPAPLPPNPEQYISVVTASGAARITFPSRTDDDPDLQGLSEVWELQFTITANSTTVPDPAAGYVQTLPAGDRTAAALTDTSWNQDGMYLRPDANGRVRNTDAVVNPNTASNGSPYAIKPGEVGVGRVQVHWRNGGDTTQTQTMATRFAGSTCYCYYDVANLTWHYDWDPAVGTRDGASAGKNLASDPPAAAAQTAFLKGSPQYMPIESRYLCSRYRVLPTNGALHGNNLEMTAPTSDTRMARLIVGETGALDTTPGNDATASALPPNPLNLLNLLTQGGAAKRCPICGVVQDPAATGYDQSCFFHRGNPASPTLSKLHEFDAANSTVAGQPLQALQVPEVPSGGANNWFNTLPYFRPSIPEANVQFTPARLSLAPGTSGYKGTPLSVSVKVPSYQPASEPDNPGVAANLRNRNDLTRNWGYRGLAVVHQDKADPWDGAPTGYDNNDRWDTYFVCPDCGYRQPEGLASPNPWVCPSPDCALRHHCVDPVTGAVYPYTYAGLVSPFDNSNATTMNQMANNVSFADLGAEEFDVVDLVVSVLKSQQLQTAPLTADMGRISPGINTYYPDITTGDLSALFPLAADPANVSHTSFFTVQNEGNTLPAIHGRLNANLNNAANHLLRPETDQTTHSFAWTAMRDALPDALKGAYYDDTSFAGSPWWLMSLAGTEQPWQVLMPQAGNVSGKVGNGVACLGGPTGIVGTGKVLGHYDGIYQVYFVDQSGNGQLDFVQNGLVNGATTTITDTSTTAFNPDTDQPLEPCLVSRGRARVSETRFPYNHYFAKDTGATPYFTYDNNGEPTGLQVIWMSDRQGTGTPSSQAPMNLWFIAAPAAGAGETRTYNWPSTGGTPPALVPPGQLTAGVNPLERNGPADVFTDSYGGGARLWAVWAGGDRVSGGPRFTIQLATSQPGGAWSAPTPVWVGDRRPQGVRGLYDGDYAHNGASPRVWVFWHSGINGHEQISYQAMTLATGQVLGSGVLPLDNSVAGGDPNTVVQAYVDPDGLGPTPAGFDPVSGQTNTGIPIQKLPHGPFISVKDVSPILYLPPVVYSSDSGNPNPTQPELWVFFAGYARNLKNYDIYQARFKLEDLLTGANNRGKLVLNTTGWDARYQRQPHGLPVINPTQVANGMPGAEPGEQFTPDVRRQEFYSMDPDWLVGSGYVNGGGKFILGVRLHGMTREIHYYDVTWVGNPARGEGYDPVRGVYTVIPRLQRHNLDVAFQDLPRWGTGPAAPVGGIGQVQGNATSYELISPSSFRLQDAEKRPLTMEIDPATGVVRFSAPLFNPQNPGDESCVFNEVFSQLAGKMADVFLCGDYEAYLKRLTYSSADDDNPTAILQAGAWTGNAASGAPTTQARPWPVAGTNHDIVLFWRRTYGSGQAPYFGRTNYLMKRWSWAIKTDYPPMQGPKGGADPAPLVYLPENYNAGLGPTGPYPKASAPKPPGGLNGPGVLYETRNVPTDTQATALPTLNGGGAWPEYDVDLTNGEIVIWPGTYRWWQFPYGGYSKGYITPGTTIFVQYTDVYGNKHLGEPHTIGGWSQETVIPIDTVLSEGPLRVSEEVYSVPPTAAQSGSNPAWPVSRRYWLFWTSPRPLYDLRPPAGGGGQMRQSSDIYFCTVAPEVPAFIAERNASDQAPDPFRP